MSETGHLSVGDILFRGNQDPDHPAIECLGCKPLSYRELRLQIISVVKTLNSLGFHPNDRIAVITPPGPETAVIMVAVTAGFTLVPLNHQNKKREYENYFSLLRVKAVIVQRGCEFPAMLVAQSQNIPVIELIPVNGTAGKFDMNPAGMPDEKEAEFASSSDIANILLTSGTTSQPKIVFTSQRTKCLSRQRQTDVLKITSSDRCLHIVPYYHGMGLGIPLLGMLFAGGTVICTKDFIPSDFIFLLKTFRPSLYTAGPALHQGILREIKKAPPGNLKPNSLRLILTGSSSLSAGTCRELENILGVPVVEHYATSETGTISINFPPKRGSVGLPVIENVTIIDEYSNRLGPYGQGEIVVQGETVFNGYGGAPDESKSAFIDGMYRTGDMGYFDDDGYLFLTGRIKELINKGGEKIAPAEIDAVLKSHPRILDAMAFGYPDSSLGEDIAAMVVPADEKVTETELRMYLLDRLVQFKVPRRIFFVDTIPRNPAGKPLRHEGTPRYSKQVQ